MIREYGKANSNYLKLSGNFDQVVRSIDPFLLSVDYLGIEDILDRKKYQIQYCLRMG